MLEIKILGIRSNERYIVRRLVEAAQQELKSVHPAKQSRISEIHDPTEINKVASVLVQPTLLVNGKIVCSGRVPTREEVVAWLREGMDAVD